MSYTVLARRYRSGAFDQVVGQEPIAKTLRNAIATGRVAHAYLFTGTRGVGKTSMARILARALNAPDTLPDAPRPPLSKGQKDPFPAKDVQQRMADAIMRGDDLNVIEIDGASNNSVDNARQLIANAGLSPTDNAHYKVYIIDEVHMLSPSAFNALLKTMEEPPEHVKFILCTTEAHKVPATIQSRCQRFDFRNIATARIAEHLRQVVKQEKIKADDRLLWEIARLGQGSMRDALSLLDRIIATPSEDGLTLKLLEEMLGLPPAELVVQLIDHMASGDAGGSLKAAAALLNGGIAQDQMIDVLIDRLRQLMIISACGPDSDLIELSEQAKASAVEQAKSFDAPGLVYMIALCENLQRAAKNASNPRALLDATVVRLSLAEKMADVTGLIKGDAVAEKKKVAPPPPETKAQASSPAPSVAASSSSHPSSPPPAPATPEPSPSADPWQALLASLADKPSMTWVRSLALSRIDGGVAHLAVLPGHRELVKFVGDRQKAQLAQLLGAILGRPIRVELTMPAVEHGSADDAAASTPGQAQAAAAMRQKALGLPLVKQLLEVFDATLIDVRPEPSSQESPAPPVGPSTGSAETQPGGAKRNGASLMFDNLKNLASVMGQVRELTAQMTEIQRQLEQQTVEAEAGAGAVRVKMNGKMEVLSVTLDPSMLAALAGGGKNADRQMVEDLIAAGVNAAIAKAQELMRQEMSKVTGGLNLRGLPGLDKLMGG